MRNRAGTLAVLITLATLAVLGIVFTGPVTASIIFSITFVVIFGSAVAAIICRSSLQAFWRGFAVFGGAYFAMLLLSGGHWQIATLHDEARSHPRRPCFVTTYLLAWAYDRLGFEEIQTNGGARVPAIHLLRIEPEQIPASLEIADFEVFMSNGQCVLTVLIGLVGGWLGNWLYSREVDLPAGDLLARDQC